MNEAPPISSGASKFKKRFIWIILIILVGIVLLCSPVIFVGLFYILNPLPSTKMTDEGFKKAKKTIDPEQLRAWALKEVPKYPAPTNSFFPPEILNSEIPNSLKTLYPIPVEDACIYREGASTNMTWVNGIMKIMINPGQTNITVFWGGPFFHWMFEIGTTNFVPPKDPEVMTIQWVPGIYYGREDTVHPFK